LITVEVKLDGKPVLQGSTTDDGFPSMQGGVVWGYLEWISLSPVAGVAITSNGEDRRETVLQGKVVVEVQHAGQVGRGVEVPHLRLIRSWEKSDRWNLDPTWVQANRPPGDWEQEIRALARIRLAESLRIPSILAVVAVVGLGWVLGLVSLAIRGFRGKAPGGKKLALAALLLCLLGLVGSTTAYCWGYEGFGGGTLVVPLGSAAGLATALIAFCRS
jgi:hypothetical protein